MRNQASRPPRTAPLEKCAVPLRRLPLAVLIALTGAPLASCGDVPSTDAEAVLPVRARTDSMDAVNAELERTLFSARTPDPAAQPVWPVIRAVYERRRYEAMWVSDTGRLAAATAALCSAAALGFDPGDYLPAALAEEPSAPSARAELDLRLSAGLAMLGRDLAVGRARPDSLNTARDGAAAARDTLLVSLLTAAEPATVLPQLAPGYPEYAELSEALARYRAVAAAGGWAAVPAGPRLRRGAHDPRVTTLRARLVASGDADSSGAGSLFDRGLGAAVASFQRRHGLVASGALDSATTAALNVPVEMRVRQLEASLERLRWLPRRVPFPYLLADLRAGRLTAYSGGALAVSTRLSVPDPAADSAPPIAQHFVRAVVLRAARIELALDGSATLFFGTADSAARLRVTPRAPAIRISNPLAVAKLLLRALPEWNEDRVRGTAKADTVTSIPLPQPVPLYLLAPTAFVRGGAVHFRPDRDAADSALATRLAAARPPGADPSVACRTARPEPTPAP